MSAFKGGELNKMEVLYRLSANESEKYKVESAIYMKRPRVINILEWDGEQYRYPAKMRYFKQPRVSSYPLDLNRGRELHMFRNRTFYDLEYIEQHIMQHNFSFDDSDSIQKRRISTSRSLLISLMKIAIEASESFSFGATKYDGIIYLSKNDHHYSGHSDNETHHYKLQQNCLADAPSAEPDLESGFDENKDLMAIHRSQLNRFDILYSSTICGVYAEEEIEDMTDFEEVNKRQFVLTKVVSPKHRNWVHCNLLQWWTQAYLANVPEIYIGFKNKDALIETPIAPVLVNDFPKIQTKIQPHVCMQFLHKILTLIEEKMSSIDCPYTVCQFQFNHKQRCFLYKIHEGQTEFSFLTVDFVNYLQHHGREC